MLHFPIYFLIVAIYIAYFLIVLLWTTTLLTKKKTNLLSPSQKLREEIAFEFLISKCSDGRLSKQDL